MTENKKGPQVVNIILDGYGFDPEVEDKILDELLDEIDPVIIEDALDIYDDNTNKSKSLSKLHRDDKLKALLAPTPVSLFRSLFYSSENRAMISTAKEVLEAIHGDAPGDLIREISTRNNYAIWAADSPHIFNMRNNFPTAITRTSGPEAGYEDIEPRVQGNSDTGHQQLGNLIVAAQLPLQISMSIDDGSFFKNEAFLAAAKAVKDNNSTMNVTILLSGDKGNNGRVHSCWNHLEAFLKFCFVEHGLPAERVSLFAILDGRDSARDSSLQQKDGEGFLPMLKTELEKYDATDSLAWIMGRSFAMDRDYDESKTSRAYKLLTEAEGTVVDDIDSAMKEIQAQHEAGASDTTITAIAIKDSSGNTRSLQSGDAFVDLNFRADRQRQLISALLNARDFLNKQTESRENDWNFDWIDEDLKLTVCCMAEYHPDFEANYGANIAYSNEPHGHNYITLLAEHFKKENKQLNYLLLAESTKALHVGYFIRGRREAMPGSVYEGFEERQIIDSYGKEKDVQVDDDFYKTPQMKAFEIAGVLANELYNQDLDFAVVNFSNPDMLGHLITRHFDAVVKAIEAIDDIIGFIVPLALDLGYHVITTADHGNADEFSPAHGSHDVLTSICSPDHYLNLTLDEEDDCIRLFDIPWAILDILGYSDVIKKQMPPVSNWVKDHGLAGRSFFEMEKA